MQFALSVWVYQRTGSVLDFAGVIVAGLGASATRIANCR
jgi:hypothetical protein